MNKKVFEAKLLNYCLYNFILGYKKSRQKDGSIHTYEK